MKFLDSVKSGLKQAWNGLVKMAGSVSSPGGGGPHPADARPKVRNAKQWLDAFNTCSYLQAPVSRLAQDVAAVEIRLFRKKGVGSDGELLRDPVWNHELLELLKNPNPFMTWEQFCELLVIYRQMTGRAAVYAELEGGRPVELYPIAPHDLLQIPTRRQPFWKFKLASHNDGKPMRVGIDRVLWITRIDPANPYGWGIGRAQAVANEVTQLEYAQAWNSNFFRNGAHIGKIVNVHGMSEENGKRMQADFESKHTGIANAHRPFFVGSKGAVDVKDLGPAHRDLEYVEGMRFLRDGLLQNWGQPPELHGVVENSNRATADAARDIHQRGNVLPEVLFLVGQLNRQLVPFFGDDLVLEPVGVVQETQEFLLNRSDRGIARGAVRIDEWRKQQGMAPYGGVIGDALLLPANTIVVDKNGKVLVINPNKPEKPAGPGGPEAAENEMQLRLVAVKTETNGVHR